MRLEKLIWLWGLVVMLAALAFAMVKDSRVIKNWRAHCGSGQCSTETDATAGNVTLRLSRAAAEGAIWHVAFRGLPKDMPPETSLALRFDRSKTISTAPGSSLRLLDGLAYITERDALDRLFPALRKGNNLSLTVIPAQGGRRQFAFSLSGIAATMLWIDEKQDRVGQPAVVGSPVESRLVAPSVPAIVAKLHKADDQCKQYKDRPLAEVMASATLD